MRILHFLSHRQLLPAVLSGLLVTAGSLSPASAQEDLTVLKGWRQYSNAGSALYNEIALRASVSLDARDRTLAGIKSRGQWERYISSVREKLRTAFGPFPERTPLNAKVVGTFEHQGIAAENIMFESRPGFPVTGTFFKPFGSEGKLPVILYVCGHSDDGYRSAPYQQVILNLARKGFAVFAIDPIGQGERLQYFDPAQGKSAIGGPTAEHSFAGLQYLPLGRTLAMVRVWDAMRAIDYLVERPDVDPARIGVHGRSGGGTLSAYVGAMDDRVTAAAPECYITSFRRLFQSIGPQDAEQNLLSQISSGLDLGDFILARAPKPTLVVTTTRDMFSIQGARETVAAARPAFAALGYEHNIRQAEDDAPHQSTRLNREQVYSFFMQHLEVSGNPRDEELPLIDAAKLRVTPQGQTVLSGAKTVHDFILEDSKAILSALAASREQSGRHREEVKKAARALSGFRADDRPLETVFTGRFRRNGYTIEKWIIVVDRTLPVPALAFIPEGAGPHPAALWLNPEGKAADAAPGGRIEALVKSGYLVLVADLPGCGEFAGDRQGDSVIRGVNYNLVFGAQLTGGSVTGIQAEAISRMIRYLRSRGDVKSGGIAAVAIGTAGPALLHAGVFDPSIGSVALLGSPLAWESILAHRFYDISIGATIVPSALTRYDLPDLMGAVTPRRMLTLDPLGGDGKPAAVSERESAAKIAAGVAGTDEGIAIRLTDGAEEQTKALLEWIKQ
ncbi:MAG: alpha/beta hydrolase family protein [Candidatus Latescibacterota bacterium]